MALESQYISIPFQRGIETKINPVIVDKSKLLNLVNYTFNNNGVLSKRTPWGVLAGTLTGTSTQAELFTQGSQLLAIDSTNDLYTYNPDANTTLQPVIQVPYCSVRKDSVRRTSGSQINPDCANSGNLTCYVYQDTVGTTDTVTCTVVDETTNQILVNGLPIATTSTVANPRVCVVSNTFCFVWSTTTTLKFAALPVGAMSLSVTATTLNTTLENTGAPFEIASYGGTCGLLVFNTSVATHTTDALTFSATGTVLSGPNKLTGTANLSQGFNPITISMFSATNAGVIIGQGNTNAGCVTVTQSVTANVLNSPSSEHVQAVNNFSNSVTSVAVSTTLIQVFSSIIYANGTSAYKITTFQMSNANATSNRSDFQVQINSAGGFLGPEIIGKPFVQNNTVYLPVVTSSPSTSNLQSTLYLLDTLGNVIAKALTNYGAQTSFSSLTYVPLPSVVQLSSNSFSLAVCEQGITITTTGIATTQSTLSRSVFTFGRNTSTKNYQTTPLWHSRADNITYLSGGNLMFYDGAQLTEANFQYFPEGIIAARNAGAGSLTAGVYTYTAIYEWVDNTGDRHQSAPAPTVQITSLGSDSCDLKCPTLQLGTRVASTYIVFYRTKSNGSTFFRLPITLAHGATGNNGAIQNITTAGDIVSAQNYPTSGNFLADGISDATLGTQEQLYTQPGANPTPLSNNGVPSCRAIANFQNRIFISGLEDPYELRFSQPVLTAQGVGLQWNTLLSIRVPQIYGEITALGVMDDKLIVFTPSRILMLYGNGPDSSGNNSTYILAPIPSDVGCIDQRSIVLMPSVNVPDTQISKPGGLGFLSQHGYYLLDRGLSLEYIGMEIEGKFNLAVDTISSAVVLENLSQLRLTVTGTDNLILVYDYLWGQWSTFSGSLTPTAACSYNNLYTFIDTGSNIIYQDNSALTADTGNSQVIVGTVKTAWFKLAALQGFQRIKRMLLLGNLFSGDSSLQVTADFNYINSGPLSYTFTVSSVAGSLVTTSPNIELRHHMKQQDCEAVSFTFVDTPTSGLSEGCNFQGITLELANKRGVGKHLAPSNNF